MNEHDEGGRTLLDGRKIEGRKSQRNSVGHGTVPGAAGLAEGLSTNGQKNLGLTELSPTEWRVVDTLRADDDAARVLGFIQRIGDTYEVTSLVRVRERTYFSSFDRAAASLDPRPVHA